jgi:Haem-NO-binding
MHGIIFSQLRKYVETKQGSRAWSTLLKRAQLENRAYLTVSEYPDAEMDALISAAALVSGQPATVVLEDFGVFIAPPLMNMYGHLIPGDWKTLDVIEKTGPPVQVCEPAIGAVAGQRANSKSIAAVAPLSRLIREKGKELKTPRAAIPM